MKMFLVALAVLTSRRLEGRGSVSGADFVTALHGASVELMQMAGFLHDPFECPLV